MTENLAIFAAQQGVRSFRRQRQSAATVLACPKRWNGADYRSGRRPSGECWLIVAACLAFATPAAAQGPSEVVTPNFSHVILNIPGKSRYVLSGSIQSQVEGEPAKTFKAGESFYEAPGAHHLEGRNMSTTKPAKLLAVFVVDTDDKNLTTPDK
jgi:hypothetical protein